MFRNDSFNTTRNEQKHTEHDELLKMQGYLSIDGTVVNNTASANPDNLSSILVITVKLKSDSTFQKKKMFYVLQRKLFQNDEKCFLFHDKNFFRTQDI